MIRCDRCGWECEDGAFVYREIGIGKYRPGSVHVCPRALYGIMRVVEAASGTPEQEEVGDGE